MKTNFIHCFYRLSIPLTLAALLLISFGIVAASSGNAPTTTGAPLERENSTLSNGDVITLGVAAGTTGMAEYIGWPQVNAVQLVVDQVNAAGGVELGGTPYSLTLVTADSACNATDGVNAANALIAAGAVAVVGHTCSGATLPAQAIYAAEGVPMVSASSTVPDVTEQGYTTTFRVITRDDSPTIMLAEHLADRLMFESAAIVEIDTFFGNWANDAFSDTFAGLGGSITSRHTITSSDDFTATLSTIMGENPDVIYFGYDNGNTAGLLSKVAANLEMNEVVIAWATFSNNRDLLIDYAAAAGDTAEGDLAAMFYRTKEKMPGYEEFNAAYQDAGFANFGEEADIWGAFAYDAANMLIAALSRTESADPVDIRDEFALTSNYSGVVGTYEGFDSKGDIIPQWAWLERYQNGNWIKELPNKIYLPLTLNE